MIFVFVETVFLLFFLKTRTHLLLLLVMFPLKQQKRIFERNTGVLMLANFSLQFLVLRALCICFDRGVGCAVFCCVMRCCVFLLCCAMLCSTLLSMYVMLAEFLPSSRSAFASRAASAVVFPMNHLRLSRWCGRTSAGVQIRSSLSTVECKFLHVYVYLCVVF